jgi:hypothetical protein
MAAKRVVISKINGTGVVRQNTTSKVFKDRFEGKLLNEPSCSIDSDNLTTYVQIREWVIDKNDYLYPPYVECEYVI